MTQVVLSGTTLRAAFGAVPSGVVAVCGLDATGQALGMAVSTFVPVSLDPPLVALSVQTTSRTWPELRGIRRLGISVLGSAHGSAARQLAAREGDRFGGLLTTVRSGTALFLEGTPAQFECSVADEIPAGDHLIVILSVHALTVDAAADPLVFHRSDFVGLAALAEADLAVA
jgi:flavin reductase (DIM6/NTAB) family NADH-FMN oxidoreductase RutF